jgi:hypothetical protein
MFVVRESRNLNTPKIFVVMPSQPVIGGLLPTKELLEFLYLGTKKP